MRVELTKIGTLKDINEQPYGIQTRIRTVKNKLALNLRTGFLHLDGMEGYKDASSAFLTLKEYGLKEYLWSPSSGWWQTRSLNQETGEFTDTAKFRERAVEKVVEKDPGILLYWYLGIQSLWPLPDDRVHNPKTGWVVPV
jgi:hypothetical protein